MSPRPSFEALRARLAAQGFRPSRQRGQNFLVDPLLCRAVADEAPDMAGEFVLEVGVGLGFLTGELLARGARVLGVEIDPRLAALARELLGDPPEFELLVVDALAGKHRLAPELEARLPREGPWQLVANLPYAIASPLLALLARRATPPRAMTILVQREVGERLVAPPGSAQRGALSVRLQAQYRGRIARRVPAQAFRPRPKVESAVVALELVSPRPAAAHLEALDQLAGALFGQRRKRLRGALGPLLGGPAAAEGWIREQGVDPAVRPQELDGAAFERLAAGWVARGEAAGPAAGGGAPPAGPETGSRGQPDRPRTLEDRPDPG